MRWLPALCIRERSPYHLRLYSTTAESQQHTSLKTIKGWVRSVRKMKDTVFVDVSDGHSKKALQAVFPKPLLPPELTMGSSVEITGNLHEGPKGPELSAQQINVVGPCPLQEGYPFAPRKQYSAEYVRSYPHLRPRTRTFASLLRVRHRASLAIHEYFSKNNFLHVHTPLITSNDCEGAGEVFTLLPDNKDLIKKMGSLKDPSSAFFGQKAFLTVSGQLHLEAIVRSFEQAYTFGPVFRAENSKSRLHLTEFYMVEAEKAFISDVKEITSIVEDLIKFTVNQVLESNVNDVDSCRQHPTDRLCLEQPLETFFDAPFTTMTFKDASEVLKNSQSYLTVPYKEGESFNKEHELFLVKTNGNRPLFIVDWPTCMKPFYMKRNPEDPSIVYAFDLLFPIVGEVCGGSLREDHLETLETKLQSEGLTENLLWYLDLRKFGNVPTGGFGLGFERLLQSLLYISNIKDTIPFPRWPHSCKM